MTTDLDEPTELINEIASEMVYDPNFMELPWEGLALVVNVSEGGSVVRMHGYAFLDDGEVTAETPEMGGPLPDRFAALNEAMARLSPTGRPWQSALVQIHRETRKVTFLFEHDDPARWAVTPDNYRTKREELRPPAA